jgi:hypothetical protein
MWTQKLLLTGEAIAVLRSTDTYSLNMKVPRRDGERRIVYVNITSIFHLQVLSRTNDFQMHLSYRPGGTPNRALAWHSILQSSAPQRNGPLVGYLTQLIDTAPQPLPLASISAHCYPLLLLRYLIERVFDVFKPFCPPFGLFLPSIHYSRSCLLYCHKASSSYTSLYRFYTGSSNSFSSLSML